MSVAEGQAWWGINDSDGLISAWQRHNRHSSLAEAHPCYDCSPFSRNHSNFFPSSIQHSEYQNIHNCLNNTLDTKVGGRGECGSRRGYREDKRWWGKRIQQLSDNIIFQDYTFEGKWVTYCIPLIHMCAGTKYTQSEGEREKAWCFLLLLLFSDLPSKPIIDPTFTKATEKNNCPWHFFKDVIQELRDYRLFFCRHMLPSGMWHSSEYLIQKEKYGGDKVRAVM